MNKLIIAACVSMFAVNVAMAEAPAAKPAPAMPAKIEAKKAGTTGEVKTTAKTAQQEKMKTCNKEATGKKGPERKQFMSACLKK